MSNAPDRVARSRIRQTERRARELEQMMQETMSQELKWLTEATAILSKPLGETHDKS
jgi:hypothetical protein